MATEEKNIGTNCCGCVDLINEELPDDHKLELAFSFSMEGGGVDNVLPIYTTRYTKAGNPKKGSPIAAKYCPFCGAQWQEDSE